MVGCTAGEFAFKSKVETDKKALIQILKVSKSRNKFMKSSFLPKNERNIARISALNVRNGDFINLF